MPGISISEDGDMEKLDMYGTVYIPVRGRTDKETGRRFYGTHQAGVYVLLAFVGPRPEGRLCCHRDGNCRNNHYTNLYWGTPQENGADTARHGTLRIAAAQAAAAWEKHKKYRAAKLQRLKEWAERFEYPPN
jgi:hypothetical protein